MVASTHLNSSFHHDIPRRTLHPWPSSDATFWRQSPAESCRYIGDRCLLSSLKSSCGSRTGSVRFSGIGVCSTVLCVQYPTVEVAWFWMEDGNFFAPKSVKWSCHQRLCPFRPCSYEASVAPRPVGPAVLVLLMRALPIALQVVLFGLIHSFCFAP